MEYAYLVTSILTLVVVAMFVGEVFVNRSRIEKVEKRLDELKGMLLGPGEREDAGTRAEEVR